LDIELLPVPLARWSPGASLLFEGQDIIARLIAAIPPRRFHLMRYFGLLSSHSALRSEVVSTPRLDSTAHAPPPAPGDQLELLTPDTDTQRAGAPKRRAWLLKHVFAADAAGVHRWPALESTAMSLGVLWLIVGPTRLTTIGPHR